MDLPGRDVTRCDDKLNYQGSTSIRVAMDFSSFNGAEQAHMTKVIEKRQVPLLSTRRDFSLNRKTDAGFPPHVL